MKAAAADARTTLGLTSPNPPVGAVAVDIHGNILARATHPGVGQSHAEIRVLQMCREQGILQQVDALCVTLEPCNHVGRTPPCTEAIIASGIKKVIIGTRDPNPHVKGGGIEQLKNAGIQVLCGVNEGECRWLIHAFAYQALTGKSWVTIKRAFNQQGSMIPPPHQKTFTSSSSLKLAHQLRKKSDAIVTGSGTILADHPLFTVRHVPDFPYKKRYLAILDRQKRVPDSYLEKALQNGFYPHIYNDLKTALDDLNQKGALDILVEAGPTLSDQVFRSKLWTMSVNIQQDMHNFQANKDTITVEFEPTNPILSDITPFGWDVFLPE